MLSPRRRIRLLSVSFITFLTAFSIVSGPGTSYASGINILPGGIKWVASTVAQAMAELPAGISVGTGIVEGATQLTIDAAAASAVAAGEVGAGVVIGGLAGGYAAGTLAWKLGGTLGDALPCLDCADSSPTIVTHGCPSSPGAGILISSTGVFSGITVQCVYNINNGGFRFAASTAVYVNLDVVCSGGGIYPFSQFVINTSFSDSGAYCSAGITGINLRFIDGSVTTTLRFNDTPSDTSTGGSNGGPTGLPVQINSTQECTNTSTAAVTTSSIMSEPFLVADTFHPAIPVPGCSPGSTRTKFSADVVPLTPNATKKVPLIIGHAMPISTAAPVDHLDYAQCLPGGVSYPCKLDLRRVLNDGTTREYDPSVDPNPGDLDVVTRSTLFKCLWGPLSVVVSECRPIYGSPKIPVPPAATSSNCDGSGFSFNPVSWVVVPLKCLFVPTKDFNQWSQFKTNASSRPPLSVVTGATSYVSDFFSGYSNTSAHSCPSVPILGGNRSICFDPIANASQVASTNTNYQKILTFIRYGLWVGFAFYAYKRITKSFGSKEIEGTSE